MRPLTVKFMQVTFIIQVGNDNDKWPSTGDGKAVWWVISCMGAELLLYQIQVDFVVNFRHADLILSFCVPSL